MCLEPPSPAYNAHVPASLILTLSSLLSLARPYQPHQLHCAPPLLLSPLIPSPPPLLACTSPISCTAPNTDGLQSLLLSKNASDFSSVAWAKTVE